MDENQQVNNENQAPPQDTQAPAPAPEQGGKGALIGAIIVVFVLIGIGVHTYINREVAEDISPEEAAQIEEGIVNLPDEQRASLEAQGSTDALSEIEEDANSTDLENLDAELQAIDEELGEL